jgi:cob(I)alamin adenosyltransferase
VTSEHLKRLEAWIAQLENRVEMAREFVVPGDSQPGAALHLARTVVRRAERHAVRLAHDGVLANPILVRYLNRLSSLLYVLAIAEDHEVTGRGATLARS